MFSFLPKKKAYNDNTNVLSRYRVRYIHGSHSSLHGSVIMHHRGHVLCQQVCSSTDEDSEYHNDEQRHKALQPTTKT